jgi:crossover junction endodeoxyribonuclease RuvC
MKVLGVDPGSYCTGWGLLGGTAHRPSILDCGVIRLPRGGAFPARLGVLQSEFRSLVERLSAAACVESPFHSVNARAALQLAHARGVILATLGEAGVPVTEHAPASVKKAVTGSGKADKMQVRMMVERLLGDPGEDVTEDVTDALAVAYCHVVSGAFREAVARSASRRPD